MAREVRRPPAVAAKEEEKDGVWLLPLPLVPGDRTTSGCLRVCVGRCAVERSLALEKEPINPYDKSMPIPFPSCFLPYLPDRHVDRQIQRGPKPQRATGAGAQGQRRGRVIG